MVTFILFEKHWQQNHTKKKQWNGKEQFNKIMHYSCVALHPGIALGLPRNFLLRRSSALAGRRLLAFV
jgi:hypothetical protein